jgi:hypothetical protein
MIANPEGTLCFSGKAQIAREILAYLNEHPDATDTLEGIAQWWLLERKIKYQRDLAREALAELVGKELVLEISAGDSRIYRTNPKKDGEIRAFLNNSTKQLQE